MQLTPQQPPPPDYYAANLRLLLGHVRRFYGDVLTGQERAFIRDFMALSSDGQRLYARLLGRKGPWIRLDRLAYREIDDLAAAVTELSGRGLLTVNGTAPADALLGLLTQAERQAVFPDIPKATKAAWIETCVGRYDDGWIRRRLAKHTSWIALAGYERVLVCQLLFFGDDRQDTSTFVLQDLGVVRFERYPLEKRRRLFADRAALERYRRLRRLTRLSHRLHEVPGLAGRLLEVAPTETRSRIEQRQRDRMLNRVGQHFERAGAFDQALECYGKSRMHPSRERRARILKRLGDHCGAERLAAKMGRSPRCAEEVDFATRFGRGRQRAHAPVTEVPLEGPTPPQIEAHAAELLAAAGGAVFHLENALPLGIAGLAFWDVIFADLPGAFANPFQTAPLDLFWPDFAATREQALAARTAELDRPGVLEAALLQTHRQKSGIANRLVSWRHLDETVLRTVVSNIPAHALLALACHVIRWPYRTRTGFPDLTVIYGPGNFEFVEVKGPTDQLQPGQRVWLDTLTGLGLTARVLKFRPC